MAGLESTTYLRSSHRFKGWLELPPDVCKIVDSNRVLDSKFFLSFAGLKENSIRYYYRLFYVFNVVITKVTNDLLSTLMMLSYFQLHEFQFLLQENQRIF